MNVYELKKDYLKLPKKYQVYGTMPSQVDMQEAIDKCMMYGTSEDIAFFESN